MSPYIAPQHLQAKPYYQGPATLINFNEDQTQIATTMTQCATLNKGPKIDPAQHNELEEMLDVQGAPHALRHPVS